MNRNRILYKLRVSAAMCQLPGAIRAILDAVQNRLELSVDIGQLPNNIDNIAYVAQLINWLAKTENEGFYRFKNILTRWLAMNHPGAYYAADDKILYIPLEDGKQLSFHVHHDTEGCECYNMAAGNKVEWDGVHRQPLAVVYLLNQIGAGDEETLRKEFENESAQEQSNG